jgi:conjugal transfer pilus assembly protein TrbC
MKIIFQHISKTLSARTVVGYTVLLAATAQASELTQADLDGAKAKVEAARKALVREPSAVEAIPSAPNLNALPQPAHGAGASSLIDIESIARHFDRQGNFKRQADASSNSPRLLAFVSLSMPRTSLERLLTDASHTRTTLVLRGMKGGDMELTMRTVKEIIGKHKVAWFIDPAAFMRFGVSAVPTYVVLKRDAVAKDCGGDQCFSDSDYAKISGDVTIDYALDQIATQLPSFRNYVAALRTRT